MSTRPPCPTGPASPVDILLFDPDWYRDAYPDVRRSRVDPVQHYLEHGAGEGRDPNRHFSTTGYLERNPDVRRAGLNPFVHFLFYGFREGRRWTGDPKPSSAPPLPAVAPAPATTAPAAAPAPSPRDR